MKIKRLIFLCAFALSPETSAWAQVPTCTLPAAVPTRVGRAQIFDSKIPVSQRDLLVNRDVTWGATIPKVVGTYTLTYLTGDRDNDWKRRPPAWYERNQPDWISYRCDQATPAHSFRYSYGYLTPIDIANLAVQQYQWNYVWTLAQPAGANGIGLDNMAARNVWQRCGTKRADGSWRQQYPGHTNGTVSAAFVADYADYFAYMRAQSNRNGLCLAANHYWWEPDRAGFMTMAEKLDIVLDEMGWIRHCAFVLVGAPLRAKLADFAAIAKERGVIVVDQLCDDEEQVTPAVRSASLAVHLLIKGPWTYTAMVPQTWKGQNYAGHYIDYPDMYVEHGAPLEGMQNDGALFWRRYENAIAIVNTDASRARSYDLGPAIWFDNTGAERTGALTVPAKSGISLFGRPMP